MFSRKLDCQVNTGILFAPTAMDCVMPQSRVDMPNPGGGVNNAY